MGRAPLPLAAQRADAKHDQVAVPAGRRSSSGAVAAPPGRVALLLSACLVAFGAHPKVGTITFGQRSAAVLSCVRRLTSGTNQAATCANSPGKLGRVSFDVSAAAYGRFMGRYSEPLAVQFADLAGVHPGQRVLDVGCGPGALTAELVRRTGTDAVSAVEPSASFAAAVRQRLPGVEVRLSSAEQLPFADGTF